MNLQPSTAKRTKSASSPVAFVIVVCVISIALVGAALVYQLRAPEVRYPSFGPESLVSVTGKVGAVPVLSLHEPVSVEGNEMATIKFGSGRKIEQDTPVMLQVHKFNGTTGAMVGEPETRATYANAENLGQLMADAAIGSTEGSRLIVMRPSPGQATEIDVVDVIPTVLRGGAHETDGSPLKVTMTDSGPTVSHEGAPPSQVTVQTLISGTGAQVGPTSAVLVQYSSWRWSDGSIVSSTWHDGIPQIIELEEAMPGVREALTDRRVGSRLAITIPPDAADGTDTLVLVVDILGVLSQGGVEDPTE